jgi:hypothetical protein
MTTSKDIEGILLVDEMTSADVKHIRTVEQPKETPVDTIASLSQFDLLTFTRDDLENVLLLVLLKFEFEVLLSVTSPEENSC